jgi:hypothetical protein
MTKGLQYGRGFHQDYQSQLNSVDERRRAGDVQQRWFVTPIYKNNYEAKPNDFVRCDPTDGALTITLPSATRVAAGEQVIIKNVSDSTNLITVTARGTEKLDDQTSITIGTPHEALSFVSNGTNWLVIVRPFIGHSDIMTVNGTDVISSLPINVDGRATLELHSHSDRARGLFGAMSAVQDGDTLGTLAAVGYDGTDMALGARIDFVVDGTPGNNDMPTEILFKTSADGSHSPSTRVVIKEDGKVGVGTTSPDTLLHLSDTAAPRLRFERNDTAVTASEFIGVIEFEHQDADDPGVAAHIACKGNGTTGEVRLQFTTGTPSSNAARMVIDENGNVGIGTTTPGNLVELGFATENLELVDAGSAGATQQDWIEVQVGNNTGYIHVYAAK